MKGCFDCEIYESGDFFTNTEKLNKPPFSSKPPPLLISPPPFGRPEFKGA